MCSRSHSAIKGLSTVSDLFSSGHPTAGRGNERDHGDWPEATQSEVRAHLHAVSEGDHFLLAVLVAKDPATVHLAFRKGAFLDLTVSEPEYPEPVMLLSDMDRYRQSRAANDSSRLEISC